MTLAPPPAGADPDQFEPVPPGIPGCPLPAVTATRVSVSGDPLTNTAMLDAGVALGVLDALTAVNAKSSNFTPVVSPLTCSAYPAAVGATVVGVAALYAHVVQSNPP